MGQHSMCQRISEVNSDFLQLRMFEMIVSCVFVCRRDVLGTRALCWDPIFILAALSGPNLKAPGFAGGYLLALS
ncbi:hypothetical protein SAMN05443247_05143 [Bradyrhizobium erythrophlei]|jgi:hypothetical protein|nr:hypothetical protein SAMN05443247_05143 [Bradyrhizobium erythrophlei]